jgi:hypothetical protein
MRAIGAAVLMAVLAATAASQETLKPGDTISGRIRHVETRHPNGTLLRAWQIVSDKPKPLAQADEFCGDTPPRTFHLIVDDKKTIARLKALAGKKIDVIATTFFCSETAWHVGDAVLSEWRFAAP